MALSNRTKEKELVVQVFDPDKETGGKLTGPHITIETAADSSLRPGNRLTGTLNLHRGGDSTLYVAGNVVRNDGSHAIDLCLSPGDSLTLQGLRITSASPPLEEDVCDGVCTLKISPTS